jgi:chromosome segregation ATPase
MSSVDAAKKKEKELRTELEQASAAHDDAIRQVAKWQAAQVNVRRLGEQLALRELKAELEGYTSATAEAKTKLNQAQAALLKVQKQLANVPAQTKAAAEKLQSQLDALGRKNENLESLAQLLTHREAFRSKMKNTASESAELAATEPGNTNLAKASELLGETVTLLVKDIESVRIRLASQQKATDAARTAIVTAQKYLDQLKLLPKKLEAEILSKTETVKSAAYRHQKVSEEEKTFAQKVAIQQSKADKTSSLYFALMPK